MLATAVIIAAMCAAPILISGIAAQAAEQEQRGKTFQIFVQGPTGSSAQDGAGDAPAARSGGAFKAKDAGGSSLRGFQGVGSINDMFANSRGGDQGTAPLVAVQKAPIKNLVGGQPTASNGSSQPPPPPPPPPSGPAAPLPVLLVIANRDFYAPPADKPVTSPTVPGASVPVVQGKTLAGGGATNQAVQPSIQLQRLANPSLQRK